MSSLRHLALACGCSTSGSSSTTRRGYSPISTRRCRSVERGSTIAQLRAATECQPLGSPHAKAEHRRRVEAGLLPGEETAVNCDHRRGPDWSAALVIVRPATVIGWHRRGFAWYWTRQSRAIGGPRRPRQELRRLVRDMANANPLWGAPRIHGELMKLGLAVSQRTISRLMPRRRRPPSQTWRTILRNHVASLVVIDFFTVPTITGRVLFVLVVLAHDRRRILHVNVTPTPTSVWTRNSSARPFPGRWPRGLCGTTAIRSSTPRSASRLGLRLDGRSHGAAVTLAESVRRARHRLGSPRVPGLRHRAQRTALAATPPSLPRVRPPVADASRARQTHARRASGRRRRSGPGRRAARGRRTASSLQAPRRCVTPPLGTKRVTTTLRDLALLSADPTCSSFRP